MLKYAVLVALCLAAAHAQVFGLGGCPKIPVMQNFDVTKYLGKWYEQERYFAIFELNAKCVIANYTAKDNGAVRVENSNVDSLTNKVKTIEGEATLAGEPGEAKLKVVFPSVGSIAAPYNIVKTDYDSYAVVFSCESAWSLASAEFCWVLTRDKNPSPEVLNKVKEVIQESGIDSSKLHKTVQDCDN